MAKEKNYFFLEGLCDKADPAAVFDAELVRPSRSTFEAAEAALADVTLLFDISITPFILIFCLIIPLYIGYIKGKNTICCIKDKIVSKYIK